MATKRDRSGAPLRTATAVPERSSRGIAQGILEASAHMMNLGAASLVTGQSLLVHSVHALAGQLRAEGYTRRDQREAKFGAAKGRGRLRRIKPLVIRQSIEATLQNPRHCWRLTGMNAEMYRHFSDEVQRALVKAKNMQTKQHSAFVRIFICISQLRGHPPAALAIITKMPEGSMHGIFREVIPFVLSVATRNLMLKIPEDQRDVSHGIFGGALGRVVGAVDGVTIPMQAMPGRPQSHYNVHHKIPGYDFLLVTDLTGVPLAIFEMGPGSQSEVAAASDAVRTLRRHGVMEPGDLLLGDALYWHSNKHIVAGDKPSHLKQWADKITQHIEAGWEDAEELERLRMASGMLLSLDLRTEMISSARLVVENCNNVIKSFNGRLSERHSQMPFLADQKALLLLTVKAVTGLVAFRMLYTRRSLRSESWLLRKNHSLSLLHLTVKADRALGEAADRTFEDLPRLMQVRRNKRPMKVAYQAVAKAVRDAQGESAPEVEAQPPRGASSELWEQIQTMTTLLHGLDREVLQDLDQGGLSSLKKRSKKPGTASAVPGQPRHTRSRGSAQQEVMPRLRKWFHGMVLRQNEPLMYSGGSQPERGYAVLVHPYTAMWEVYYYHEDGTEEQELHSSGAATHLYNTLPLIAERLALDKNCTPVELSLLQCPGSGLEDSPLVEFASGLLLEGDPCLDPDSIARMTIDQLRQRCEETGLSCIGTRGDLVHRLTLSCASQGTATAAGSALPK